MTDPDTEEAHPMLERVAKAIHEHLCRRNIMQYLANDEDCEGLARAVLSALRDLTPDVERVGWQALTEAGVEPLDFEDPRIAFTAMINTIIGEPQA